MNRHSVTIELDEFGWRGLSEEAERQGVDVETLIEHAAMYYLSDIDSGRAAVKIFRHAVADGAPGKVTRLPGRDGDSSGE